jgi:hypothetical protein
MFGRFFQTLNKGIWGQLDNQWRNCPITGLKRRPYETKVGVLTSKGHTDKDIDAQHHYQKTESSLAKHTRF